MPVPSSGCRLLILALETAIGATTAPEGEPKCPKEPLASRPIKETRSLDTYLSFIPVGPIRRCHLLRGGGFARTLHDNFGGRTSTALSLHETATACDPAEATTHLI